MAQSSLMDDKFTVYVRKSCNPGPYLDPRKVETLPNFFQDRSVPQTITKVIEAVVLAGLNFKDTFDKVPMLLKRGLTKNEVIEKEKDGKRKKHYYRLPVLDRKSKGEIVIEKFVQNLQCCSKFLSCSQRICKQCDVKQELMPSKIGPTVELFKKEPAMPKPNSHFTIYCRRNCKIGPLLNPIKIKKLPTSFSGSLPNIIKQLVSAIVLSGYSPVDAIKHVPSSQGGCILVKVKIGKLNRMCLVGNVNSSIKFWNFIKRFCSAFGICQKFFSEEQPKKSSCKKCRNTDVEADYYSSDDDDFQDFKGFKEKFEKREKAFIDKPTSVKKFKFAEEANQPQFKELKVVIERLPQDLLNHYLQRNSPTTPSQKQVKKAYLHGEKVNVVFPQLEKSPQKSLFPEASTSLSCPSEDKGEEAENLLNINVKQENTQPVSGEAAPDDMSVQNENEKYLLETFLDQVVEDNNTEVMALKEMSEKLEGNPLRGLFEKLEEQQVGGSDMGEEQQEEECFEHYSSSFDDKQLFSPGSFLGDVSGLTEISSSPERIEMKEIKRPQEREKSSCNGKEVVDKALFYHPGKSSSFKVAKEVDTENIKTYEEKQMSNKSKALENDSITPDQATDAHAKAMSSALDFADDRTEVQQDVGSANTMDKLRHFSDTPIPGTNTTQKDSKENEKVNLSNSSDCCNSLTTLTHKEQIEVPSPLRKVYIEGGLPFKPLDGMISENSECHNLSTPSVVPSTSQNSAPLNIPTVSQSNPFSSSNFPAVLQALEITAKRFPGNAAGQGASSVGAPQSLSVDNVTSGLTSTFGPLPTPGPLDCLSSSGISSTQVPLYSLPGNVSNSGFPARNGTYSTPKTPVVSLPGNPSTNSSFLKSNQQQFLQSENSECHNLSTPSVVPSTSQHSALLNIPTVSQSNPFSSSNVPAVLQTLEITAKRFPGNAAGQGASSVGAPQSLSVDNVTSGLTSTFGPPPTPGPLDCLSSSGIPSTQVPFYSLPGNVSNSGFPARNGTYSTPKTPVVSLPGNPATNSSLPSFGMTFNQVPLLSLPGNVSNPGFPVTNGIYSTPRTPVVSLPGNPATNSSFLKSNRQQFLQIGCNRNTFSLNAIPHTLQNGMQQAESLRQTMTLTNISSPTGNKALTGVNPFYYGGGNVQTYSFQGQQLPCTPFVTPNTSAALQGPYPYNALTNNFMANSLNPVQSPKYYPPFGSQATQSLPLNHHSQVQAIRYSFPPTNGLPADSSHVSLKKADLASVRPFPVTNQPSSEEVSYARHYPPSTSYLTSQSVTKTTPSSEEVPNARHYPPSTSYLTSQSVTKTTPSSEEVPNARHYPPSTSYLTSQSVTKTTQSSEEVPNARHYPPSTSYLTSQSVTKTTKSSEEVPNARHYPPSTSYLTSQSVTKTTPLSERVPYGQSSQSLSLTSQASYTRRIQTIPTSSESNDVHTGLNTYNNNVGEEEVSNGTKKLPEKNPLANTKFILMQKCQSLPKERRTSVLRIIQQMLRTRQQRLAITYKDIKELGEFVGPEIKNDSVFCDFLKLITASRVVRGSNGTFHTISNSETNDTCRTQTVVIDLEDDTPVTQSQSSHMETVTPSQMESDTLTDNGIEIASDNVLEISSMPANDDVVINDQLIEKESLPASGLSIDDNQPTSDAVPHAESSTQRFNSLLPRPILQVSKIQDMTILLWDIPDQSGSELVKEYELYAIQLKATERITKDLIRSMTWMRIGIVRALPTPMAITLTNLVQGFKNYMLVRAIGSDNCAGPFSRICEVICES